MVRIGFVHNSKAAANKKGLADVRGLEDIVVGSGGVFAEPETAAELDAAIDQFEKKGTEVIVINGGDGTFHFVFNSYIRKLRNERQIPIDNLALPRFLVLPGGTANVLSKVSPNYGNVTQTIEKLAESSWCELSTSSVRTLTVSCDEHVYFGAIFAAGAVYRFMKYYEDKGSGKKSIGKAVSMITRGILDGEFGDYLIKPDDAILAINDRERRQGYMAVLACGFKPSIIGIRPFNFMDDLPAGKEDLGSCFYEAHTSLSRGRLVLALPFLFAGRKVRGVDYNPDAYEVRIKGNDAGFTLDGELYTGNDITVEPGPLIKLVKVKGLGFIYLV